MEFKPIFIPEGTKYGNNRWEVYSPKIKRRVKLYSDLEYYHWLTIEMDPNIISFCEQPLKIPDTKSPLSNHNGFSIPDMIMEDTEHNYTIVEVKHRSELQNLRTQKQLKIQQGWAEDNKFAFRIFTDDILKQRYLLATYKQIIQCVASIEYEIIEPAMKLILSHYKKDQLVNIQQILSDQYGSKNTTLQALYYLIYQGRLRLLIQLPE
ncbi:TnsA endonuclease N-terminal domain-containing protein [Lactiplantibacillus carotarum]|uniref:TnsA endonuclease N-terminal domain-containing protein n=1 Tax=Lactiplantibacillus carotarum TaxID=2993456 RepID=UPI00298EE761|nr:TnsA endonuclease N-terminal domain-containing protein [Lactiplantibacillus carotarum]